ncbi:MAG: fasciclin domain-containing protein [Luteolibacter sp.]|uniref:fasciclin domain-containing protein n=1 Tax=Luteolibacter sp. TaxID=1962973 RepID=UPI003265FC84
MKLKNSKLALLISLIAAPIAFAAEVAVEKTKVETKTTTTETITPPVAEPGTLTATISDSVTFTTLKKALAASGLDVVLADKKGVYTIFAPTDEAFDKLPAGTLGKLMLPQNKEKLRSLLLYHVIAGKMTAAELKDGQVTTMNGEKVKIEVDGEKINIGDTKVFSADVMATNGVMHSVGDVMVPKSLDGFAKLED